MNWAIVLQGIAVGFATAAPVGPIGLLCIQNTLSHGIWFGITCGLGAATADMLYGCLVALGLPAVANFMLGLRTPLSIGGGLFLIYLGLCKFWATPVARAAQIDSKHLIGAYISTFFLTLTNPATILDFMALLTGLRIDVMGYAQGLNFVGGVFAGSAFWWLLLCGTVGLFRRRISQQMITWINYGAGVLICGFGIWVLFKAVGS